VGGDRVMGNVAEREGGKRWWEGERRGERGVGKGEGSRNKRGGQGGRVVKRLRRGEYAEMERGKWG